MRQKLNRVKALQYAIVGIAAVISAGLLMAFDALNEYARYNIRIQEGTIWHHIWKSPAVDIYFNFYIFNITNSDAFMSGRDSKLKLEEIGPYVFQEMLEHKNVQFHQNGTVTYMPTRSYVYRPERSTGDLYGDVITTLNVPYIGATSMASEFSSIAAFGMSTVAKTLNSKAIINVTVHDCLFGYDNELIKLASKVVPSVIPFQKFGFMDRIIESESGNNVTVYLPEALEKLRKEANNRVMQHVVMQEPTTSTTVLDVEYEDDEEEEEVTQAVKREEEEVKIPFMEHSIDLWNGSPYLPDWEVPEDNADKQCVTVKGIFDGFNYPREATDFKLYRKAFCRAFPFHFTHSGKFHGLAGNFYELDDFHAFNDDSTSNETKCFCNGQASCNMNGLGSISSCYYNFPFAVSSPHFYKSNQNINHVDGMAPDEAKHKTNMIIHEKLGCALNVQMRIQVNLNNGRMKFNSELQKRFENLVVPLFWMDINMNRLPLHYEALAKLLDVVPIVQVCCIAVLIFLGCYFIVLAVKVEVKVKVSEEEFHIHETHHLTAKPFIKKPDRRYFD